MVQAPIKYHLGEFPPKAIDWLELLPLIGPATASLARYDGLLSAIPKPTANRILTLLREDGLLVTIREGKGRKPALHAFPDLLNIAEGKVVL